MCVVFGFCVCFFFLMVSPKSVNSGVELDLGMENKLSRKLSILKILMAPKSWLCSTLCATEVLP